jgi:hypothetical protein
MPLISVSGAQGVGKTTFINDFIATWPMYKTPERTYRDIIKERGLSINKETSKESQKIILDSIVESIDQYSRSTDYVIFDRSPLDNLVYSLWALEHNKSDIDDEFISECIQVCRECLRKLDIMLFLPLTKYNSVNDIEEVKETRDSDPVYQQEINTLFMGLRDLRERGDDAFFVREDCGPIIEVFGTPEERIEITKLYLRDDGNFYGDEDSMLLDAQGQIVSDQADEGIVDNGERDDLLDAFGIEPEQDFGGFSVSKDQLQGFRDQYTL